MMMMTMMEGEEKLNSIVDNKARMQNRKWETAAATTTMATMVTQNRAFYENGKVFIC